jgi:hypothetical protein
MVQVRKLVLAIAAASALSSGMAHALGLGELTLKSTLNQPLVAEIELLDVKDLTAAEVVPSLASPEDFAKAGVDRQAFLNDLTFHPGTQRQWQKRAARDLEQAAVGTDGQIPRAGDVAERPSAARLQRAAGPVEILASRPLMPPHNRRRRRPSPRRPLAPRTRRNTPPRRAIPCGKSPRRRVPVARCSRPCWPFKR